MGRKRKVTMGKQKIEIKRLENEDARFVCFTKRKEGIFSKASELATLCGAEVAIMMKSPTGCPYSFGSPSVNPVADRFLSYGLFHPDTNEHHRSSVIQGLNNHCMELSNQMDTVKQQKEMVDKKLDEIVDDNRHAQMAENIDELNLLQLKELEMSIHDFQKRFLNIVKHLAEGSSSSFSNRNVAVNPIVVPDLHTSGSGSSNTDSIAVNPSVLILNEFGAYQNGTGGNKRNHNHPQKKN